MSIRYLDLSGAVNFWTNIKNYILSKIPTKTSELTNDSGFLTQHQSLSNYVTLNSNQTITAIKTITGGNQGKMIFKNPNFTVGTTPESATTVTRIYFGGGASYDGSTGVISNDIASNGNSQLEICALNNNSSSSYRTSLILRYEQDQTRPRFIKSWGDFCPYSDNTYYLGRSDSVWKECYCNAYYLGTTAFGDIVTHNASEFLTSHQSLSSCVKNVVTNNQTIKSTGITRGTAPSSAQTFGIAFSDNNNKYIGNVYGQYATDKSTYVGLYAYKGTTTSNSDNVSVRVGYDASGNAYTYAPTPATADNSTQIATTAFVKAQGYLTSHQSLANYVTIDTVQDIEGNKNFKGLLTTIPDGTIWPVTANTTDDITYLGANAIHVEQKGSGKLTDLSGGAWSVAELGVGCFFFRINNGADIRYKNFAQNTVNRIPVVSNANRFINDVTPNADNTYSLGSSSLKWKACYSNAYYLGSTAFGDIVTHNASEFLTSHQSLANYVTTNTDQTISGIKSFSDDISTKKIISNVAQLQINARSSADSVAIIAGANASDGSGIWLYGKDNATGSDCRIQIYNTTKSRYERVDLVGSQFLPNPSGELDCGGTSNKWKSVYATNYYYGNDNVEFSTKFVTTDTDQSISGIKSHSKHISILGDYIGNEFSTNARTCLYLKSNRDTDGKSGIYFSKYRQNRAQGALTGSDLVCLTLDVLENSVRTNNCISVDFRYFENDIPTKIYVAPKASMTSYMGTSDNPWTNAYITNLNLNGNAFDPASTSGNIGDIVFARAYYSAIDNLTMTAGGSALALIRIENEIYVEDRNNQSLSGTWKFLGSTIPTVTSGNASSTCAGVWKRIA